MKKHKKRHRKKSHSSRRKRTRTQTSRSNSSVTTSFVVASFNKEYNCRSRTASYVSSPSSSRSSCIRRKAVPSDFAPPVELSSEGKLKSIASYIDDREEMVHQMFASLHKNEVYELLPKSLKKLEVAELRNLCAKELHKMSKENIRAILKGKDFAESGGSEGEEKETAVDITIKTSKAEIAVADSTTEMIGPNIPVIFDAIDADDTVACSSIISAAEVQCAAVENLPSTKKRQENETVVQCDFTTLHRTLPLSQQHAEIQVETIVTTQNVDELEDGEVVSDEEKNSNSDDSGAQNKDQNCRQQRFTVHKDIIHDNSSPASMHKNSRNAANSTNANKKIQEEKKLHMLELELRARAIEALIKRSDNKS